MHCNLPNNIVEWYGKSAAALEESSSIASIITIRQIDLFYVYSTRGRCDLMDRSTQERAGCGKNALRVTCYLRSAFKHAMPAVGRSWHPARYRSNEFTKTPFMRGLCNAIGRMLKRRRAEHSRDCTWTKRLFQGHLPATRPSKLVVLNRGREQWSLGQARAGLRPRRRPTSPRVRY